MMALFSLLIRQYAFADDLTVNDDLKRFGYLIQWICVRDMRF